MSPWLDDAAGEPYVLFILCLARSLCRMRTFNVRSAKIFRLCNAVSDCYLGAM